jgi:tetratricopeptide (TPR) repeat protein
MVVTRGDRLDKQVEMPLAKPDRQHLRSACGYVERGMFQEAQAELEEIDPFCRHLPEVLAARIPVYRALGKWDLMAIVAKQLTEWNPDEPENFIDWAYATRQAESIHMAHAILSRGAQLHPDDGLIQFNLACYESQLGNPDKAKAHLKRATAIDRKFRMMALEDLTCNRSGRHSPGRSSGNLSRSPESGP